MGLLLHLSVEEFGKKPILIVSCFCIKEKINLTLDMGSDELKQRYYFITGEDQLRIPLE